jgi:flagellar basal-body rod protein FlgG
MDGLFISASGIAAAQQRQAITANNVANLRTPGYRSVRAELLSQAGGGVSLGAASRLEARGPLKATGQPLDLATEGYFQLRDAEGNTHYTRDGRFGLNADGQVVTASGLQLDPPVNVPPNATSVNVTRDGTVFATIPGAAQPQAIGQIEVVTFPNPSGLQADGNNAFTATPASGQPQPVRHPDLATGVLEQSNVNLADEQVAQILNRNLLQANVNAFRAQNETIGELLNLTS